jgi:hypothetical protein
MPRNLTAADFQIGEPNQMITIAACRRLSEQLQRLGIQNQPAATGGDLGYKYSLQELIGQGIPETVPINISLFFIGRDDAFSAALVKATIEGRDGVPTIEEYTRLVAEMFTPGTDVAHVRNKLLVDVPEVYSAANKALAQVWTR